MAVINTSNNQSVNAQGQQPATTVNVNVNPQFDPNAQQPNVAAPQPQGQPGFDPNNPTGAPVNPQVQPQQPQWNMPNGQQPQGQWGQQTWNGQQQGFQQQTGFDPNNPQFQNFNGFGNPTNNIGAQRLADLSQMMQPRVSRGGTSARAAQFVEKANKILELDKNTNKHYRLFILTPEQDSVALTSVAIAAHAKNTAGQDVVAIHSLIIEGGTIEPRKFTLSGFHQQQIQIESTAGDTYTETYWQILKGKLGKMFGASAIFEDAHANIIASESNLEDETTVRNILAMATVAVDNTLILFTDPNRFRLTAEMIRSDNAVRLTSKMDFNPPEALTSNGLPIRADISISTALEAVQNFLTKDFTNPKLPLVTTDLYLDLAYMGNQNQNFGFGGMPQFNPYQQSMYKTYMPRVVITNVDSQKVLSLELVVLGLISSTLLFNQQSWISGFRTKLTTSGGPGIRSIAAVGYEVSGLVDKPGPVDLAAVNLADLINTVCYDQLIYSMDVPEIGDNSYLLSVLIAAANNDRGAYNSLIAACNDLTGNLFGQMWQVGAPILVDDKCRIHNGYFFFDNKAVDFRELDYLAILGLFGDRAMENVWSYANSFRPETATELQRLEERYRILQIAEGAGHMHLKGYSRRLTFTGAFINTLLNAFTQAGLNLALEAGYHDNTTTRRYMFDAAGQLAYNPIYSGFNYQQMFNVPMSNGMPTGWGYGRTSAWV